MAVFANCLSVVFEIPEQGVITPVWLHVVDGCGQGRQARRMAVTHDWSQAIRPHPAERILCKECFAGSPPTATVVTPGRSMLGAVSGTHPIRASWLPAHGKRRGRHLLNPRQQAAAFQPGRSIAIRIGDGLQTCHVVIP